MNYVILSNDTQLTKAITEEVAECDGSGELYFFLPPNAVTELRVGFTNLIIMGDGRQVNIFVSGLESVHRSECLLSARPQFRICKLFKRLGRNALVEFNIVAGGVIGYPSRLVLVSGEIEWEEESH